MYNNRLQAWWLNQSPLATLLSSLITRWLGPNASGVVRPPEFNCWIFCSDIKFYALLSPYLIDNLAQAYISGLLKQVSETHTRSLRSSENGLLSVPRSCSALYDLCLKIVECTIRSKPCQKVSKRLWKHNFKHKCLRRTPCLYRISTSYLLTK